VKKLIIGSLIYMASSHSGYAALLGSELSIETLLQSSSTSATSTIGFLTTATVVEPGIEFVSLQALETTGSTLVDVAINAGNDFIEIDFTNTSPLNSFNSAFKNGYMFTFDTVAAIDITGATIDTSVTSLGLSSSDLVFSGNQLFVNVEGLSFNTSTFARINLTSTGGVSAVPLPSAMWLFGSGLIALSAFRKSKCLTIT